MSKTMSVFLDLLRVLAALTVVIGHLTQPQFSHVWPDETRVAIGAVAVFFVLSGFVISYVVQQRETSALEYAAARISRIYSVLVPAILLSSIVLLVGLKLDPSLMQQCGTDLSNFTQPRRILVLTVHTLFPLTLFNGLDQWNRMYPPLDSPIWSIGYEVTYYFIFGIAAFSRGKLRILLLAVIALLCGTNVLRLLPVWLLGVWLHRLTLSHRLRKQSRLLVGLCLAAFGLMAFFLKRYVTWVYSLHSGIFYTALRGNNRADDAGLFYYVGVATALCILSIFLLERRLEPLALRLERPIHWLANRTFALYLFHLPLLFLFVATTGYNRESPFSVSCALFADILLCLLLSPISENRKHWWRAQVRRALESISRQKLWLTGSRKPAVSSTKKPLNN